MATENLTVDSALLTSVSIEAAKEARDMQFLDTPFCNELARVHGAGKPFKDSGHTWVGGFNVGDHSSPTRRRTGYEQLNLSFQSVMRPMRVNPAEIVYPIGISDTEEDNNGGRLQTIDMATERVSAVMGKAKREFEQHMLIGGVAGYEDFYTLNGIDYADGVLENVAPGSQNNVIGGFSKATFATLPGTQNQFADLGGAFGTNGNLMLTRIITKAKPRTGHQKNMCVLISENGMEHYKRTLFAKERYATGDDLDSQNLELYINGTKALISPVLGSFGGATPITVMLVDINEIHFCWSNVRQGGYFSLGDWKEVGNGYDVRVCKIKVRGQTWVKSWASSGILTNGEAY